MAGWVTVWVIMPLIAEVSSPWLNSAVVVMHRISAGISVVGPSVRWLRAGACHRRRPLRRVASPPPSPLQKLACLLPSEGDPTSVHPGGRLVLGLLEGRLLWPSIQECLARAGDRDVMCSTSVR